MICHECFQVDPWSIRETHLDLSTLAQTESLFTLSNGHVGVRGNLDEGEPHGMPGTYLNGFYEVYTLPYAEAGYGFPHTGQTVINVTNGKLIRLLLDDEPFDLRYGRLNQHTRVLDFRSGTLTREVTWTSPAGRTVRVRSERLVSLTQRSILAIRYEVEPLDREARVVLQSELVANEQVPTRSGDPRAAASLSAPLVAEEHMTDGAAAVLVHRTRESGLRLAASMDHTMEGTDRLTVRMEGSPDLARLTLVDKLGPGQSLKLVKLVSYGWSRVRTTPAVKDQVGAALAAARRMGWDELAQEQRNYLLQYWTHADVQLTGDTGLQQAVRFGLFQVLQATARAEHRGVPAKGLTGTGYDGHIFWDAETFVLPVVLHSVPKVVEDALRWRHATLPTARKHARALGLRGAAFPWRTLHGEECSGYWPAGTAAFHVNADIAEAVARYLDATEDERFEREVAVDLFVETARLWRALGHHDLYGAFRIDGVTGPDEYTALSKNNVFTNLMARRNLMAAVRVCERQQERARALGVTPEEVAAWRSAADRMFIPFNKKLGVHEQAEGFTFLDEWNFAHTKKEQYPLMLSVPYFDLYRKQVCKQADLVLAMHLCGDAFTVEEKERNFRYYERICVRDSSLSAQTQGVLAAEVGHLGLARAYLDESARIDLEDLETNTRDGLHLAALAGAWSVLVAGFGGMRNQNGELCFSPRLPDGLSRLAFSVLHRRKRVRVVVTPHQVTYQLERSPKGELAVEELEISHYGERFWLRGETAETRDVPALPEVAAVSQPEGREPRRKGMLRAMAPHLSEQV
jgi:alpha,alpha-trehalose phosphorylase